jgi:uncharacterized protein (UPF0261 family)
MRTNFLKGQAMAVIAATGDAATSEAFAGAIALFRRGEENLVYTFPPDGSGAEMEARIREGAFAALFDFSPVELLSGTAGPDRLTAAGVRGIPQLISVCGLDNHPVDKRLTTPEERDAVGKVIVERACAAKGPTLIALPLRGFHGEGADDPLFQSIRSWVYPPQRLVEFDFAIDDPGFGVACASELLRSMNS